MFNRFKRNANIRKSDNGIFTTVPIAYSIPYEDWKSFKKEAVDFLKRTKPDEANPKYFDANITSEWQLEWSELFRQNTERTHTLNMIINKYDYYTTFNEKLMELIKEKGEDSE